MSKQNQQQQQHPKATVSSSMPTKTLTSCAVAAARQNQTTSTGGGIDAHALAAQMLTHSTSGALQQQAAMSTGSVICVVCPFMCHLYSIRV